MTKTYDFSIIEIWTRDYINFPDSREEQDKNKVVVQCEPGSATTMDYIVEVVDDDKLYFKE